MTRRDGTGGQPRDVGRGGGWPTAPVFRRRALDFDLGPYDAVKDPCPVYDGARWHLFGTGCPSDGWAHDVLHATADDAGGPWRIEPPARLYGVSGGCVAAPGVIAEGDRLHMFVQTEYNRLGGRIEHLCSEDGGRTFRRQGTALESLPGGDEAGIYDGHPADIAGSRYLVYSGFRTVGQPDLFLARSMSGSWGGPYQRLGRILEHPHVPGHNQLGDAGYEWGLEGAQLLELSDGRILLHAVCFLSGAPAGCRQRVFVALADEVLGPYQVLGPAIEPVGGVHGGENGHGGAVMYDGRVMLFFQERPRDGRWGYGLAEASLNARPSPEKVTA